MSRAALTRVLAGLLVSTLAASGCRSIREVRRPDIPAPPTALANTTIDYVDTDGFDVLFEAALVNRDAIITVRTQSEKPDWTGRLNGWIAAWNMGKSHERGVFRGQIPVPSINADTLREFRLLIGSVVDRADDASRAGAMWWKEERVRSRRVELLKPYNLRFHIHTDGKIHLIFFNGSYAQHYPDFVAKLTENGDPEAWTRTVEVSQCKKLREARARAGQNEVQAVPTSLSFSDDRSP